MGSKVLMKPEVGLPTSLIGIIKHINIVVSNMSRQTNGITV